MWQYILFLTGFAVLQTLSLLPLVHLEPVQLFECTLIQTVLFGLTGILVHLTLKFGKFNNLPAFQRMVNYVALVLLYVAVTVGATYGLICLLFGDKVSDVYYPLLPLVALLSFMVCMMVINFFVGKYQDVKEIEAVDTQFTPEITEQNSGIEKLERIAVKSGQKIHVVMVPEIVYLQADGDYVQIYTMQGKYLKEQTMKYFEEHLPESGFVRVHRSCIVNVEAISRIDLYEKQTQQLTLKNGHQIKVSQAGYKLLRSRLSL